jgi:deoxyadenosine/deoxycytidine kinase
MACEAACSTPIDTLLAKVAEWAPELVSALQARGVNTKYAERHIAVCGGIGAGKSTLLSVFRTLSDALGPDAPVRIHLEPEPTEAFGSALAKFYDRSPADILKYNYAFVFQAHVFAHQQASARRAAEWVAAQRASGFTGLCLVLQERCAFDATAVFMRLAVENGIATTEHEALLQAITSSEWRPDGMVFVRASADTCVEREKLRAREAEKNMQEAYVRQVAERYDVVFGVRGGSTDGKHEEEAPAPALAPTYTDGFVRRCRPGHWAAKAPVAVVSNDAHWDTESCYAALMSVVQFVRSLCLAAPATSVPLGSHPYLPDTPK